MNEIYKKKYIKYKTKYLREQYGGTFDLNENTYTGLNTVDIKPNEIEYIAGPVSLTVINNTKYNKKIYLFGDIHTYADKFTCDGNATNENTIYLPDYLKYYFDKNKNIPTDLFMESHYMANKIIPSLQNTVLENIQKKFSPCFKLLSDKTECREQYPHIRFHTMDIRYYMPKISDNINIFTHLLEYISYTQKILCDETVYNDNISDIKNYISDINSIIPKNDTYNTQVIKQLLEMLDEKPSFKSVNKIINFALSTLIALNTTYCDKKADLINMLVRTQSELCIYNAKITHIPPHFLNTIRDYIGDEYIGIYDNIDDKFWNLVESSLKIKKNLSKIVRDNFEPKIYTKTNKYMNEAIKNIMKSGNMSCNDALSFSSFLGTVYGSALMDVYLLGRIFKTFSPKLIIDIPTPSSADNIIIIAGNAHIDTYIDFFTKIDGSIFLYKSPPLSSVSDILKNPSIRCVNVGNRASAFRRHAVG